MTFFEKLAEKVGIKKAINLIYGDCPSRHFAGMSELCPEHGRCSVCWAEDWNGQKFNDTDNGAVICPGDIVAVNTPDGFKIGRVKKADRFVDVWIDQTNVAAIVERNCVHKIVNAYVITGEVLGGTDEEVEKGLRDAYEI